MSEVRGGNLVAQANKLIEARYTITKNEQLLLFAMISLIEPKDKEFLSFTTTTQQLSLILGVHPATASREFDKITDRLLSRVIKISTPNGWKKLQWVSNAEIENNIISLRFHDDLKPYLLTLKEMGNFTQFRLGIVVQFRSVYTIRMYQILKEYDSKHMRSFEFSLLEFRDIMLGKDAKTYPLFKNFRNKIIDVSRKELDKIDKKTCFYYSDLSFSLETKRTGRKISHLKFSIIKQQVKTIEVATKPIPIKEKNTTSQIENTAEVSQMINIGISQKKAYEISQQYSPQYIQEKINVLKEKQAFESVINSSGFLISAIEQDFKSEATIQKEKESQRLKEQRRKEQEEKRLKDVEDRKNDLGKAFSLQARTKYIATLSAEEQEILRENILQEVKTVNPFFISLIKDKKLTDAIMGQYFIKDIPNFEENKKRYIEENL